MNRIFGIAIRHWKALTLFNSAVLAISSFLVLNSPRSWTADTSLILPTNSSDLVADLGKLGSISGGEAIFSQQVNPLKILSSILLSNDTLSQALLSDPEKEQYEDLDSYERLFTVSPEDESTIISITASGSSPEIAKARIVGLMNAFQQRLTNLREDDAAQRTQFMAREVEQAERELRQAEIELAKFKQSSGLVSSEDQTQDIVEAITKLTTTQAEVAAQFQASQAQVKMLSSRLGLSPDQAIRSLRLGENQQYQSAREKLAEVDAKLVEAQALLTDQHPQVQYLLAQRNELLNQIAQYVSNATDGSSGINTTIGSGFSTLIQQLILAESNASALKQQAYQLQQRADALTEILQTYPSMQAQLVQLQRRYDIAEGVYNGLVAKVQEAKLNAFGIYPSVQVLDQPSVSAQASTAKKKIAASALLASLFGSAALILLLESRNPLLSPVDVQEAQVPVLESIPYLKSIEASSVAELDAVFEFQRLASAVSIMQLDQPYLVISSATSGEGKTTVALGLANALTTLGFQVLLVDGDFHRGDLSKRLNRLATSHLTDLPRSIRPGLDFISTQTQLDGETAKFIARGGFKHSLETIQATRNYDYILIDSSPVCITSEATLLAVAASNVLLVVRPGFSKRYLVQQALDQFNKRGIQPIGVILNGISRKLEAPVYNSKSFHEI